MKKLTSVIKENAEQLRTYSVAVTLQVKFIVKALDDGEAGSTADDKVDEIESNLQELLDGFELTNYQMDGVDEMGPSDNLEDIKESFLLGGDLLGKNPSTYKNYSIGTFVKHKDNYSDIWKMQHDGSEFEIYNGGRLDTTKAYLFVIKSGQGERDNYAAPIDLDNIISHK